MRDLAELTEILLENDTPETIRAAVIGMNPQPGDRSPIEYMHEGKAEVLIREARSGYLLP